MLGELEERKLELARANELVASLQRKGGEILLLSPAAAKASALLKSGMTLTQIYSKYVQVMLNVIDVVEVAHLVSAAVQKVL